MESRHSLPLPILRLKAATLTQGGCRLIESVTLDVSAGDRLCLLGPPGAGKSLLLELMAGRHVLSGGHRSYPAFTSWHADSALGVAPRFAIQLVSTEEQRRVSTQYATFHQARWHALFTEPDTVETFLCARRVYGLNDFEVPPNGLITSDHDQRLVEILGQLAMDHLLARRVAALSNGELRKLLLARALLARPRLLLLDDPLGGLDPEARLLMTEVLNRYCNSNPETRGAESAPHAWRGNGETLTLVVTSPRPDELQSLISRTVELDSTRVSVPRKNQALSSTFPPTMLTSGNNQADSVEWLVVLGPASTKTCVSSCNSEISSPILKLNRASVYAGKLTILDSVTLLVQKGEHWLITGPNGSGKSTLLALLLGDHPQSYGVDLEVLGLRAQPGVPLFERKRRISQVAPELALHYPPKWTARDVVLSGFAASIGHYVDTGLEDQVYANNWLALLGLTHRIHVPFGNLTQAEQRRVLLARALVRRPSLLLLDEPTQGLAETERKWIYALLDKVTAKGEMTLLLVSHHPDERPRCITHHLALQAGRVIKQGPL
jgi:molybdate transport system ATP-binding protein